MAKMQYVFVILLAYMVSLKDYQRLLTGPDLVKDTFARRFKRGGDFM
jgi:hypothetical protein